ncbi:NAD(P)-binding protein [Imleria badia]|nr:NAD(P)-binding protein [Imleria badia]
MGLFQSKSFNPLTDLPDLSGKVIIVTGGNTGIGYATVKHLARKGAKVYMAARNKTRAEEAIAKLKKEGLGPGNGEVIWLELDLIDPRNAKTTAQEFMKREKRLDIIGIEALFVVNVISPFVLTRELMPVLNQTAAEPNSDVRVVVVGSDSHLYLPANLRFRNLDDFNNDFKDATIPWFARYGYSKLGDILYASELQRKLSAQGSPITVVALDPGPVNTFSRKPQLRRISWLVEILVYPFFTHPDVGAYTSVFAAASPDIVQSPDKFKGAYLVPVGIVREPKVKGARSGEELAKELWETIERFLAEKEI